jgi:hypothetical protein
MTSTLRLTSSTAVPKRAAVRGAHSACVVAPRPLCAPRILLHAAPRATGVAHTTLRQLSTLAHDTLDKLDGQKARR